VFGKRLFKGVRVPILQMQQTYNVEIIMDAASEQRSREEHDVPEKVLGEPGRRRGRDRSEGTLVITICM